MEETIRRFHRGLAWLIVAGLAVEVYLVGAPLFRATTFEPHRNLGWALATAVLLLLILTLIADRRRRMVGLSGLLVALTIVQVLLPSLRTGLPWVAALHAINVMALMAVTAAIARAPRAEATPSAAAHSEAPGTAGSGLPAISLPEHEPAPLTR